METELTISLSVIDPVDARHARNNQQYIEWLERTERELKESRAKFIPLKPKVTRENLYNL